MKVSHINKYSTKYQKSVNCIKDENELEMILIEHFQFFFIEFLENLRNNIPRVILIIMKLIHSEVKKKFTIDSDCYQPVYTYFVFNFLTSPKIQEIFLIDHIKIDITNLNRLIRVKVDF